MTSLNPFKTRLLSQNTVPQIGTWLMSAAPATAEAMGFCGFDFLVVDMEHVPIEFADTVGILRTIAGTPAQALVRLAWSDQLLVKRALDIGARSLMFPFIQNAEEARAAVAYTRYPPDGIRGVAAVHRGSQFGTVPNYLKTAHHDIAVIVQLETPQAIANLEEVAAVPGVDALFVGPGDLSAQMGRIGEVSHPQVQALIKQAAEQARRVGKPIGIVGPNPDMVKRFLEYGYGSAAVASDIAMMTGRANEWRASLTGQAAVAPATAAY